MLAEQSDIKVFRHFPFWFQMSAARVRTSWGGMRGPYGGLFLYTKKAVVLVQEYLDVLQKDREEGFFHGRYPVSHDNHMLNMDYILELGLTGRIRMQILNTWCLISQMPKKWLKW